MSTKKIVITGSPGTGKTSIIKSLEEQGFVCFPEISREVTLKARRKGIEQLFLTDALVFSEQLLAGRIEQYIEANNSLEEMIFLDRGIPDVIAYMHYIGKPYPKLFTEACKKYVYDTVFLLPPWETIYTSDEERYENFEQATAIHNHLSNTYKKYGYKVIETPIGTISDRAKFILNTLD